MRKEKPPSIQPEHIPAVIRDLLAFHEALYRLGFHSEDVFVAIDAEGRIQIQIQRDEKKFSIGDPGWNWDKSRASEFVELWKRAANMWNGDEPGMTKTCRARIYHESRLLTQPGAVVALVVSLCSHGIGCPGMPEMPEDVRRAIYDLVGETN